MIIGSETTPKEERKTYFTGIACVRGHVAERYEVNRTCVVCALEVQREDRKDPKKASRSREKSRINYANNKKHYVDKARRWRENNSEKAEHTRLKYHASLHGRAMRIFSATQSRCKTSGVPFSITLDWVQNKLNLGKCELTGLPFQLPLSPEHYRNPYGPSLDRRNPKGPYSPENCRMVLWALNMGFSDWGEEVYRKIAETYLERNATLEYDL